MLIEQTYLNRLKNIVASNNIAQIASIIKLKVSNRDLCQWIINTTSFLPETSVMTARVYCIINNITKLPLCNYCKKPIKFRDYNFGFNSYCGAKCSAKDPEVKNKKKATNRERYGSDYFLGTKECLEKTRITNLEKYGVENVANVQSVKDKKQNTCLEKYGVHHAMLVSSIKDKVKQTNLEKYGTTHNMNNQETLAKNKEKYGHEYFVCSPGFKDIATKAIKAKYGDHITNVSQVPEVRAKAKDTMASLYGTDNYPQSHYTNFEFWNDVKYIKNNFIINDDQIDYKKACSFFNAAERTIQLHFRDTLGFNIKSRQGTSQDELDIIDYIRFLVPDIQIEQGNRSILVYEEIIGDDIINRHRELDIYLPEYKLAIEFDGLFWHSLGTNGYTASKSENKRKIFNLQMKVNMLQQKGIRLLDIWENEWHTPRKQEIWKSMIRAALGKSRRLFARECVVQNITPKEEIKFLVANHIQGYVGGSSHRYGLFYKGILKAVMTFGKARFENDFTDFELLRFATEKKHTIIGGASKLLTHFQKAEHYPSILSFANKRWSSGKMYDTLGFALLRTTNPSPYYFLNAASGRAPRMLHWTSIQKHNINKLIDNFDPDLSAEANLFNNGYRKIYDAGQLVYLLK
jgi:hypothetical protein